jgi:uncharacterized membrane protein
MLRFTSWTILPALLLPVASGADRYISFDVPGATTTAAQGVNDHGAVVGAYVDASGKQHGFLLDGGNYTTIDYSGAISTGARGINNNGDIVGVHIDAMGLPGGGNRGFLLRQGSFSDVNYPGHLNTIPVKVKDGGQIVGCYHENDTMASMHGFVYADGNYSALDGSWGGLDMPASMNNGVMPDASVTAGLYTDMMTNITHGYLAGKGVFAPFDFPFSISTSVWDMSSSGEVIGTYTDSAKKGHGFVLGLGDSIATFGLASLSGPFQFTSVDFPGATTTSAIGINNRGDVVGSYVDSAGKTHAFFLSRSQQ